MDYALAWTDRREVWQANERRLSANSVFGGQARRPGRFKTGGDDEARNQLRGGRPWCNTFPDNHLGASSAVARSGLEPSCLVGVLLDKVWELPDGLGPFCGGFSDHNPIEGFAGDVIPQECAVFRLACRAVRASGGLSSKETAPPPLHSRIKAALGLRNPKLSVGQERLI